jgi:hypothetical protein
VEQVEDLMVEQAEEEVDYFYYLMYQLQQEVHL